MQTKPLLYGLIGFFLGGLLVSIAATTIDAPTQTTQEDTPASMNSMSMDDMAADLENKSGDAFDKAFITGMIAHHQGAVDMAELAEDNAKHQEVKDLSREIVAAQQQEIAEMKQWQIDWGYASEVIDHSSMGH